MRSLKYKTPADFWAGVDIKDNKECWNWQGPISVNGYGGMFVFNGIRTYAHRHAFAIHNNYYPQKGMCICHTCDNRRCCNPAHLWEGTHSDNIRDMYSKNRQGNKASPGSKNHNAKLNEKDIKNIFYLSSKKTKVSAIAKLYNVYESTIYNILKGKTWQHVI